MTGFVIVHLGISPMFVLGTDLIVGAAPPEKAGSAAAMSETSTEFGVALGVAVLGTVGTALYRDRMTGTTVPSEVPAQEAESARESLPGAMATVDSLPIWLHDLLLDPARAAFTHGLNIISGISALLVAALAILAVRLLPRTRPGHATTEPSRGAADAETTTGSTGTTNAEATNAAAGTTKSATAEAPGPVAADSPRLGLSAGSCPVSVAWPMSFAPRTGQCSAGNVQRALSRRL